MESPGFLESSEWTSRVQNGGLDRLARREPDATVTTLHDQHARFARIKRKKKWPWVSVSQLGKGAARWRREVQASFALANRLHDADANCGSCDFVRPGRGHYSVNLARKASRTPGGSWRIPPAISRTSDRAAPKKIPPQGLGRTAVSRRWGRKARSKRRQPSKF